MATYVYETIPASEGEVVRTYEIRHSMKDAALSQHPETGEPIRRVIKPVGWASWAHPRVLLLLHREISVAAVAAAAVVKFGG